MSKLGVSRRNVLQYLACFGAITVGSLFVPKSLAQQCLPTGSDIKGPFYIPDAPNRTAMAGPQEPGQPILIRGTVFGTGCKSAISNALLDVWQADARGHYHNADENYKLRGQMKTGDKGVYEFTSIMPGRYKLEGGLRPAHIHFTISHPDFAALTTQLYFKGDPYLAPNDACGDTCKSNDPNRIIELKRVQRHIKVWFEGTFDIILAADQVGMYQESSAL
jgi:catechol 1,2-dioxygenase